MDRKRKTPPDAGDSAAPRVSAAKKLQQQRAAKKKRANDGQDVITRGVGQTAAPSTTPNMARLASAPVLLLPSRTSVLDYSPGRPALGLSTSRSPSATLLGNMRSPPSPFVFGRDNTYIFRTGLTPSMSPGNSDDGNFEMDALDDADVLPQPPRPITTPAMTLGEEEDGEEQETPKRSWWEVAGRTIDTVYANVGWFLGHREQFLLETLLHDGPPQCKKCIECVHFEGVPFDDAPVPEYRYEDCRGGEWCKICVRDVHRYTPFHHIEHFNGQFWEHLKRKATLSIELQLMHPAGEQCTLHGVQVVDNFAVVHETGIHRTRLLYCSCANGRKVDHWAQLMRSRLWPATTSAPKTATTFEALDTFLRLSMLGRLSGYDYHKALEAASDGARVLGLSAADCSRFKAQGQANQKGGKGYRTIAGVAGVFCARHEFWLPLGLAPLVKGERFSVIDYISCMVHRYIKVPVVVHSYDIVCQWHKNLEKRLGAIKTTDGALFEGARAMLDRVKILVVPKFHIFAHVLRCFVRYNYSFTRGVGQTDGEGCERIWAGANPAATSLRELGPGSMRDTMDSMCSSWNWQKACGLVCVDYVRYCGTLTAATPTLGLRSYVVARRAFALPTYYHHNHFPLFFLFLLSLLSSLSSLFSSISSLNLIISFLSRLVPQDSGRALSLNLNLKTSYLSGGRVQEHRPPSPRVLRARTTNTSCEELALRGREASDPSRRVRSRTPSRRLPLAYRSPVFPADRMETALTEARTHAGIFTAFTTTLEERDPETLAKWDGAVHYFENDDAQASKRPCPYEERDDDVMQSKDVEALAEATDAVHGCPPGCNEGHAHAQTVDSVVGEDEDEMGKFLLRGLKIEDLRAKSKAGVIDEPDEIEAGTDKAMAYMVLAFKEDQVRLMPTVGFRMTGKDAIPDKDEASTAKIYLPSELPASARAEYPAIVRLETSMRWTRMQQALGKLRTLLQLSTYINKLKVRFVRGQGASTRACSAQEAVHQRVNVAADMYRHDRAAYLSLAGDGTWTQGYRELKDWDVRGLGDRTVEQMEQLSQRMAEKFVELNQAGKPGEKRTDGIKVTSRESTFAVSWIWYNVSAAECLEISDALMVEWCKARARAQRSVEEVITLLREMDSILRECESEVALWEARALRV
ncbi:unnamed protein product [Peniophora sp. CBMAI 1063]|nr:unnamed protein product [Peniophora sp. CBMAI 1063]